MVKKTLEEKIKEVSFWTFVFFIIYLIIGYLLQTNWLDRSLEFTKLYELLKDGLSITAALLAPVAAFVLFSDWRVSHRLINNEKEVIEIQKKIHNTCYGVQDLIEQVVENYEKDLTQEKVRADEIKVFKFLSEILGLIGRIEFSGKNFKDTSFHFKCNGLLNEQYIVLSSTLRMFEAFTDLDKCKRNSNEHQQLQELIFLESKFSSVFFELAELFLNNFDKKIEEIDDLANAHRIN